MDKKLFELPQLKKYTIFMRGLIIFGAIDSFITISRGSPFYNHKPMNIHDFNWMDQEDPDLWENMCNYLEGILDNKNMPNDAGNYPITEYELEHILEIHNKFPEFRL